MTNTFYRQGDILFILTNNNVSLINVSSENIPPPLEHFQEPQRLIIAEGERTGHAHAIEQTEAVGFRRNASGEVCVLDVRGSEVAVTHEEHAPIMLPPGRYEVIRQREYDPGADGQKYRPVKD